MGKSRTPSQKDKPKNHKNSVKKRKLIESNHKILDSLRPDTRSLEE